MFPKVDPSKSYSSQGMIHKLPGASGFAVWHKSQSGVMSYQKHLVFHTTCICFFKMHPVWLTMNSYPDQKMFPIAGPPEEALAVCGDVVVVLCSFWCLYCLYTCCHGGRRAPRNSANHEKTLAETWMVDASMRVRSTPRTLSIQYPTLSMVKLTCPFGILRIWLRYLRVHHYRIVGSAWCWISTLHLQSSGPTLPWAFWLPRS